ncbi:MAG: response regulator [Desulfobacteraceae bacterium]|nr:response regulator [Desulfobacteraceae bacterium]
MKISIRWAVIIGCIVLVWGTQLIIMPFSFFSNKKVMLGHTKDIMQNILDLTLEETQNFFSIARGAAHLTKRLISSQVVNANKKQVEKLELYFIDQLEIYPQFAGIYFATPRGDFYYVNRDKNLYRSKFININKAGRQVRLTWRDKQMNLTNEKNDPQDTYDPRKRPWYQKAIKEKNIIWTDPYVFFSSQKPGITTAGPIYSPDGSLVGVVGVDIELDVLSGFIGKLRVGKTGMAFIINRDKNVIAFPDMKQLIYQGDNKSGKIRLPKLNELQNPLCNLAFNAIGGDAVKSKTRKFAYSRGPIFAEFESGGKKYHTMFTRVEASTISWMIGVYIPEADYFGEINANRNLTLLITLLVSVLATIGGLMVAGRIIRPISELDRAARQIKNNDYSSLPQINTIFDQIQRTADTFYDMKNAVVVYKKELKKTEEIHRAITDTANEAIFMVDDKGKISYWNTAAHILFGYDIQQAIGNDILSLEPFGQYLNSEDLSLYSIFSQRENNQPLKMVELKVFAKDGQSIPVELSMVGISIQDSQYAIFVIRDISAKKKNEKEKLAIWKQLQQARKIEAIGTLAGGIAHDFNNILSGIFGYAELLRAELKTDTKLQTHVDSIIMAGDRARSLVRQILTFSFQNIYEFKPLKIQSIIKEACNLLASSLPGSIKITRNIDDNCRLVLGDATQIYQVALNLITNACHAMEEKGGILSIGLKEVELSGGALLNDLELEPGHYLCYSVIDTGVGINDQVMDKIFDPYFTTKAQDKGTGLGLAVIKGIVQSHGGKIHVESKPGKGSRFRVFLPLIEADQELGDMTEHTRIQKGCEHILLVDDQKEVITIERQILEVLGYQVTSRFSGKEALETFIASPSTFDMVITDMSMPAMTGEILAQKLLSIQPDLPIILLTGYSEDMNRDKARALGIKDFLMKPVKLKEFSNTIREVLDNPH